MDLDRRLAELKERVERRRRLASRLERARESLTSEYERLSEHEKRLAKEARDVDRLDGLSLANLFHTILGDKHAALERERQELLSARLKRDEARRALEDLQHEVSALETELAALGDPDAEYLLVLAEKEELLRRGGGETARRLLDLSEEEGRRTARRRELEEAIAAGEEAADGLGAIVRRLESARNWGTWDLLGGGLLATAVKHSRLSDARYEIHAVQQALRRFQRELGDVAMVSDVTVEVGSLATFADYFFDGLIADWIVQSRINESLGHARSRLELVRRILADLRSELEANEGELAKLEERRREIVAQA